MSAAAFAEGFPRRLVRFRENFLPVLKQRDFLLRENPAGNELTPEPDSPRPYASGDDIRAVDWNLFARLDRLYLKTVIHEDEVPLLLLLDTSGSMAAPEASKLARSQEVAAALGDLFLSLGHEIVLVPWNNGLEGVYGPYRGQSEISPLLEQILRIRGEGTSDLRRSLRELAALESLRSASPVIISDFLFPRDYTEEVFLLARRPFPTRALHLLADGEDDGPLRGNLILVDPETGEEAHLHGTYGLTRRFRDAMRDHLAAVKGIFLRAGSHFRREQAGDPFEAITRNLLT